MSATIAIDGLFAARLGADLIWRVRADDPKLGARVERALNAVFGASWQARAGEYVPDRSAAIAIDAAEAYGADVISIDPPSEGDPDAIY